ncbi:MAG: hypothetical protein IJE60_01860 [Tyzzerella sp.]|nr:hypothetical protein [Tyzzerella sp.]
MNRENYFYERLKQEYEEFMDEVHSWDSEKIVNNAKYIGDYIRIFEYLMRDKPIREGSYLDCYDRLKSPLKTICDRYQEEKPPMHDLVNSTIWNLGKEQLPDESYSEIKYQFLQRIAENYTDPSNNSLSVNARNLQLYMFEYIRCNIDEATDEEIKVLMQFKNPFRVIMESQPVENAQFEKRISETAQSLMNKDIMTMPYELDHSNVLSETRFRQKAINNINDIVLYPNFNTTMKWLELCRDVFDGEESNIDPYASLIDAFDEVSNAQGYNTLQQIYDMGNEHTILPNEVIEAGKYLDKGGSIDKVPKLAEYGYFDGPYEENRCSAEEFLERQGEEQGGMTMM